MLRYSYYNYKSATYNSATPASLSDERRSDIHSVKTTADIDALLAEAERHSRSNPARLRELAEEAYHSSVEIGYERGLAFVEFYRGMVAWRAADYERALPFYERAFDMFEQLDEAASSRRSLRFIGLIYQALSRNDRALEYFSRELELWEQAGDVVGMAGTLTNMAISYMHISQYDLSLEYYFKALALVEEQTTSLLYAGLISNIANLYMELGKYTLAMEYLVRALEMCRAMNDRIGESRALLNIGLNYFQMHKYELALDYSKQSLKHFEELEDKGQKAIAVLHLGQIYAAQGNNSLAMDFLAQSYTLSQELHDMMIAADTLRTMGDIYSRTVDYEQAETCYSEALTNSQTIGRRQWEYELHELLAKNHEQKGDVAEALSHYKQYLYIRNEVQDERRRQSLNEMQVRFNAEKAEREKEIYRLKNIDLADALNKVELLNTHLEEVNAEKNEVLRIVAHDLKSPLSGVRMVSSLLKEHHERMAPGDLVRELGEIEKTADTMLNTVHSLLDVNAIESGTTFGNIRPIDIKTVLSAVVEVHSKRALAKHLTIRYKSTDKEQLFIMGTVEALRQIADNLISNAVKFSMPGRNIDVSLQEASGLIRIEICDEGPGIEPKDQEKLFSKFASLGPKPTGGESTTGVGLWIVKKTVDTLKGSIDCYSKVGEGTRFIVEFPGYSMSHSRELL